MDQCGMARLVLLRAYWAEHEALPYQRYNGNLRKYGVYPSSVGLLNRTPPNIALRRSPRQRLRRDDDYHLGRRDGLVQIPSRMKRLCLIDYICLELLRVQVRRGFNEKER